MIISHEMLRSPDVMLRPDAMLNSLLKRLDVMLLLPILELEGLCYLCHLCHLCYLCYLCHLCHKDLLGSHYV